MKNLTFTYSGSEAVEMMKTHFPKTWEQELVDGQTFLKSLMRMYKLSALDAYQKFLNQTGCPDKAISTLASLHTMNCQVKIGREVKECRTQQLDYGNQLVALEASQIISYQDKKTLRQHYLSKQDELQQRIDQLISDYPVIGAQRVIVQTNLFEN